MSIPAGDLRRALAASERLCILLGDDGPLERRDVAVLYLHAGDLAAASVHLAAYMSSSAAAGMCTTTYAHPSHMVIHLESRQCFFA